VFLNWDHIGETEHKQLVSQLEKTRNDLRVVKPSIERGQKVNRFWLGMGWDKLSGTELNSPAMQLEKTRNDLRKVKSESDRSGSVKIELGQAQ
jgi:hypothetical protein